MQSGVITGCNIGIFSGSEFFQSGQAVVQAHGIALAVFASMDKIVYKKRIVLEHDAALECISYLKSGIPGINRLEHPSTDIFYDADAVRKPADTDTVAGGQVLHLYGCTVRYDIGLLGRLFMKEDAEGFPMFATHIAAQHIQSAGKYGVIAGDLTPETAQGVFCYMFMSDSLYLHSQTGEV